VIRQVFLLLCRGADKSLAFPISPVGGLQNNQNGFFLDEIKKIEQQSHKCVEQINFFNLVACFLYKAKDLPAPPLCC
jgi:hypothetical protein